jgi:hypothetical protein
MTPHINIKSVQGKVQCKDFHRNSNIPSPRDAKQCKDNVYCLLLLGENDNLSEQNKTDMSSAILALRVHNVLSKFHASRKGMFKVPLPL